MLAASMPKASEAVKNGKAEMVAVKCAACGRMLLKAGGNVEVDCRRCKGRNIFDYESGKIVYIPRE